MSALSDYVAKRYPYRLVKSYCAYFAIGLLTLIAVIPLFGILGHTLIAGSSAIDWAFLTQLPKPVGEVGGGLANAIVGSLILVALATLVGVFWGLGIGIYLAEYGRGLLAITIRFVTDLLSSVPSIVIGLFVYATVVMPMRRFSAIAGGIALGIMMIPMVARNTEEMLRMVPITYREAGLALGIARWRVILSVALRAAIPGVLTGVLLAMARIAGETAPLLFTALNNRFWHEGLDQPISSLPVQIFTYAISPFDDWHQKAWGAAIVLVGALLLVNFFAKVVAHRLSKGGGVG